MNILRIRNDSNFIIYNIFQSARHNPRSHSLMAPGIVFSSLDLHPVLEGEADVLPAVNRSVFHKAVPVILFKCRERAVHLLQAGNEPPALPAAP